MALPAEALVGTMRANQKYLTLRTTGRRAGAALRRRRQHRGQRRRCGDRRRQRARAARAPVGRALLLGPGPQGAAREPSAGAGANGLPCRARAARAAVERLVALAGALVPVRAGRRPSHAERAALLAKADLVTGMVGEFPELQGIMGGHYAAAQGEPAAVAAAIRDHYAPKGPDDSCPKAPVSVVVALADKLDTLAGFFAAGSGRPAPRTRSRLRRAALGVIRLILREWPAPAACGRAIRRGARAAMASGSAACGRRGSARNCSPFSPTA